MTQEQINKTIARIIISTKRKKRKYSLFEIAVDINDLKKEMGTMQEVSKVIGVSSGMLNRFLSVFKLSQPIVELVKKRKIDSIAMALDLSKLNEDDALKLADLISSNKLSTQDLRTLIAYRKQYKDSSIIDLSQKIQASKNIKVSVIRINKKDTTKTINQLDSSFVNQIGKENLIKIVQDNNFIDIKLSKDGEKILRQKAKLNNKTLQELITTLIN